MNHFEAHMMFYQEKQTLNYSNDYAIKSIYMTKRKNGECYVRNFKQFFFGFTFNVPAFKVGIFASDLEIILNGSKLILAVDISFCYLLHFYRSQMQIYIIMPTKEKAYVMRSSKMSLKSKYVFFQFFSISYLGIIQALVQ